MRRCSSAIKTPICLDESIHTVRIARDAIDAEGLPDHQHQARPRRRPPARRSSCTICAPRTTFRSGTAACSRAASAAPTTSTSPACRTSRCPATSPPASATSQPDLIEPAIEVAADGTIAVPDGPGIGVNIVRERVEQATERHASHRRARGRAMTRRAGASCPAVPLADRAARPAGPKVAPAGARRRRRRRVRAEDALDPAARGSSAQSPAAAAGQDLVALLGGSGARVRRRAALAIGPRAARRGGARADDDARQSDAGS